MKLKLAPLILCTALTGFVSSSTLAQECDNRHPTVVKKGPSGKRISGYFYGQYLEKKGIRSTLDFFFLGHGLPEGFISDDVRMWRPKKDSKLAQKIRNTPGPFAVHYSYTYVDSPDHEDRMLRDPFTPRHVYPYYELFEHSPSYSLFYDEYMEACAIKRGKKQKSLTTAGHVVRVERKGFIKQTRSCNVYINTGQSRTETRKRIIGYTRAVCPQGPPNPHVRCSSPTAKYESYQAEVPVIELVVAHSNEACSYAEDTGRSQVPVEVEYSERKRVHYAPNNTVIHRITVQKDTPQ